MKYKIQHAVQPLAARNWFEEFVVADAKVLPRVDELIVVDDITYKVTEVFHHARGGSSAIPTVRVK